jgi:hypothetical protein
MMGSLRRSTFDATCSALAPDSRFSGSWRVMR